MSDAPTVTCPACGKTYVPVLGARRHPQLRIQDEFPRSSPIEREQLLTGLCSDACWDQYLGAPPDRDGDGVEDEAVDEGDGTEPETI